jgi:hypothetical protein
MCVAFNSELQTQELHRTTSLSIYGSASPTVFPAFLLSNLVTAEDQAHCGAPDRQNEFL